MGEGFQKFIAPHIDLWCCSKEEKTSESKFGNKIKSSSYAFSRRILNHFQNNCMKFPVETFHKLCGLRLKWNS